MFSNEIIGEKATWISGNEQRLLHSPLWWRGELPLSPCFLQSTFQLECIIYPYHFRLTCVEMIFLLVKSIKELCFGDSCIQLFLIITGYAYHLRIL